MPGSSDSVRESTASMVRTNSSISDSSPFSVACSSAAKASRHWEASREILEYLVGQPSAKAPIEESRKIVIGIKNQTSSKWKLEGWSRCESGGSWRPASISKSGSGTGAPSSSDARCAAWLRIEFKTRRSLFAPVMSVER